MSLHLSNDRGSQAQICYMCLLVLGVPAASNLLPAQNTLQGKNTAQVGVPCRSEGTLDISHTALK